MHRGRFFGAICIKYCAWWLVSFLSFGVGVERFWEIFAFIFRGDGFLVSIGFMSHSCGVLLFFFASRVFTFSG